MIKLMFVGLAIMPLCALTAGALFFNFKNRTMHVPSFLLFGVLTIYVDLHYFFRAYEVSLANSQWGPAATTMGLFSIMVTLNCFAFGLLGSAVYSLFSHLTKKQDTFSKLSYQKIGLIALLATSTATVQIMNHHAQSTSQKIIAEASGDLTPEIVSNILQLDQGLKDKTLITALLLNPKCPESVLKDYAQKPEVIYRATVLKNPNVTQEIVESLAKDQNEVVRYHVVINGKTSTETLLELTKDSSKDVRKKAQFMLENRKTN